MTTRADQFFNPTPKRRETSQPKPVKPPKYALQCATAGTQAWKNVEDPYTTVKDVAYRKLDQHEKSPLRRYWSCEFRVIRLRDNQVMRIGIHNCCPR